MDKKVCETLTKIASSLEADLAEKVIGISNKLATFVEYRGPRLSDGRLVGIVGSIEKACSEIRVPLRRLALARVDLGESDLQEYFKEPLQKILDCVLAVVELEKRAASAMKTR